MKRPKSDRGLQTNQKNLVGKQIRVCKDDSPEFQGAPDNGTSKRAWGAVVWVKRKFLDIHGLAVFSPRKKKLTTYLCYCKLQ